MAASNRFPSPGTSLFDAAPANLLPHSPTKIHTDNASTARLPVIGGTADHTVPCVSAQASFNQHPKSMAVTDFQTTVGGERNPIES